MYVKLISGFMYVYIIDFQYGKRKICFSMLTKSIDSLELFSIITELLIFSFALYIQTSMSFIQYEENNLER